MSYYAFNLIGFLSLLFIVGGTLAILYGVRLED